MTSQRNCIPKNDFRYITPGSASHISGLTAMNLLDEKLEKKVSILPVNEECETQNDKNNKNIHRSPVLQYTET